MTTGVIHEQNQEKHMNKQMGGCMAGFFNLFDRNSLLSGKRVYAKRLPASSSSPTSSAFDSTTSEPVSTTGSPATLSRELDKPLPPQQSTPSKQSPSPKQPQSTSRSLDSSSSLKTPPPEKISFRSPAPQPESPSKSPLSFEFKEGVKSPWKFTREAPRLSLDSRAITDAKGSLHPRDIKTKNNKSGGLGTATDDDDDNDRQRRSPSVIARLMGLEPPSMEGGGGGASRLMTTTAEVEMEKKSQLRRSASESRSRDLLQYRYVDGNNHGYQQVQHNSRAGTNSVTKRDNAVSKYHCRNSIDNSALNIPRKADAPVEYGGGSPLRVNPKSEAMKNQHSSCNNTRPLHQRRSSYYDPADFFPEPKQSATIYGEIERRLKMRGIDEPSKDLETLKQILEALQLKGLLHSKHSEQISHAQQQQQSRNYVFDRRFSYDESPIVVMKPGKPSVSRRMMNDSPPRRNSSSISALNRRSSMNFSGDILNGSPKRPIEVNRTARSPVRNGRSSSPPLRRPIENRSSSPVGMRRKQQQGMLTVETQRRTSETTEQSMQQGRRVSPVQSPRMRRGVDHQTTTSTTRNRSPRNRRPTIEIDGSEKINGVRAEDEEASTTISESSFSTSSYTDTERSKMEEHKEGRILLERCDKLLSSIAEMTATSTNELQQPSPVSVLDSSFYKEDSSPSPVMKRTIDFKDHLVVVESEEDQAWSPSSSSANDTDDCPDFTYVSEILRATTYFPHDEEPTASNLFQLLEKQQSLKGKDTSEASKLERKLIFDTITEILGRNQLLPPWKTIDTSLEKIWSEFQKIRGEQQDESGSTAEDLLESVCGVLKKDLAGGDSVNGWGDFPVEVSEAVLDIERLIYKDLIGETIRDLAEFAGKSNISAPRRKLVF